MLNSFFEEEMMQKLSSHETYRFIDVFRLQPPVRVSDGLENTFRL